ncbi:hypothetical protein AAFF_G00294190 [Aldrovandia affinis]|uniref:Uncharacterized protein n=1 Tax=Aldrovandia affinis TaxID=143900 RepID=A0AAD7R930_9TELE|nr:hypothetical protein AAFF_G00294190 [Aldrovandia affinis]
MMARGGPLEEAVCHWSVPLSAGLDVEEQVRRSGPSVASAVCAAPAAFTLHRKCAVFKRGVRRHWTYDKLGLPNVPAAPTQWLAQTHNEGQQSSQAVPSRD